MAFDLAMAKLVERIRQSKDRKKVHRGKHRPVSLHEASADGFSVIDITPAQLEVLEQVAHGRDPGAVRRTDGRRGVLAGRHPRESLSDDPHDRLAMPSTTWNSSGHDFFLFIDAETDRPSVVYRRKGWDYGVIGLEDEEAVPAKRSRRA